MKETKQNSKLPERVKTIDTVIKNLVTDNGQLIEIIADQVKQNKEWTNKKFN